MSTGEARELSVLFADVAGSVELYSALGDFKAHNMVLRCLERMTILVERNHGWVANTIGDEILCAFEEARYAFKAACEIQGALQSEYRHELDVKIGIHSGLTGMDNNYPFGDTVNIAARIVALAKAGQIMLSEQTYERLSDKDRLLTRHFDNVYIKGKRDPYVIYEATLDHSDDTHMVNHRDIQPAERRRRKTNVTLRHADSETIIPEGKEFLLGRGKQCGLKINSKAASRVHVALEFYSGKLIISDQSTNGTFILTKTGKRESDNKEHFVHHESWTTTSSGILCLGEPIKSQGKDLIYYNCH